MKPVEIVLEGAEGRRQRMMKGVNPTKIYFKHIHKYHNVPPIQILYANKIIKEEDTTIVNIYASNFDVPNFMKQTLLNIKEQIGPDSTIVRNFNTPLSSIDRSCRQKN
jgi:hypothetical protein